MSRTAGVTGGMGEAIGRNRRTMGDGGFVRALERA